MFDVSLFFAAIGLAVVFESCLYALFPEFMHRMLTRLVAEPTSRLRLTGLAGLAIGLVILWLARS